MAWAAEHAPVGYQPLQQNQTALQPNYKLRTSERDCAAGQQSAQQAALQQEMAQLRTVLAALSSASAPLQGGSCSWVCRTCMPNRAASSGCPGR